MSHAIVSKNSELQMSSEGTLNVYPSSTNFILLRQKPGHQVFGVLAKDGIVTRNQNHEPALRNCVRISIGSQESMLEVITSLTRYQTELEKNQQGS